MTTLFGRPLGTDHNRREGRIRAMQLYQQREAGAVSHAYGAAPLFMADAAYPYAELPSVRKAELNDAGGIRSPSNRVPFDVHCAVVHRGACVRIEHENRERARRNWL